MTRICFENRLGVPLHDALRQGFSRLSLARVAHLRAYMVVLWRTNGEGIEIQAQMHDIAERLEVGALVFTRAEMKTGDLETFEASADFHRGAAVSKLVLRVAGTYVESGLVLSGGAGSQLMIVAGAQPFSLAVRAPMLDEPFDPEYPISQYLVEPVTPQ